MSDNINIADIYHQLHSKASNCCFQVQHAAATTNAHLNGCNTSMHLYLEALAGATPQQEQDQQQHPQYADANDIEYSPMDYRGSWQHDADYQSLSMGESTIAEKSIHSAVRPGILKRQTSGKLTCTKARALKSKQKNKGNNTAKAAQRYINYHC